MKKIIIGAALIISAATAYAEEAKPSVPPPPNPDQKITLSVRKLEKLLAAQKLQSEVDEILSEIQGQIKAAQPVPKAP